MEKIIVFVKEQLKNDCTGHDFLHAQRVVNNAKKILKEEKGNERIIFTACYLHDTVDEKLFSNPNKQIDKIRKLLIEEKYTIEEIDEIIMIITNISFHLGIKLTNKNAQIVQDADRLDAIGSLGIIRTIQYGNYKMRAFYEDQNLKKINNHYEFNEITSSTLSHFYEKLLKIQYIMNTEVAKKIAIKRTKTIEVFLKSFYEELED